MIEKNKKIKHTKIKHTIKGKWATIIIETNLKGLPSIIQDAYDNAVSEINGIKPCDSQDLPNADEAIIKNKKLVKKHE